MDHRKMFFVEPGAKVHLAKVDPFYTGEHEFAQNGGAGNPQACREDG